MLPNICAVEASSSLVASDLSVRPRHIRILKYNPNNQDSILASKFKAKHALMHSLSCGDSTCPTHYSSYLNSNREPKNNHNTYCDRNRNYTASCEIKRQDHEYYERLRTYKSIQGNPRNTRILTLSKNLLSSPHMIYLLYLPPTLSLPNIAL